ncbi:MAG TPA: FAD-binding oxidoreductase [Candidatus Kryptonia bacterium]|nr:FAD-binding oxidoreductase [Candidatus Kryptonia bacterium]
MSARIESMRDHRSPGDRVSAPAAVTEVPLTELSGWGHHQVVRGHERLAEDFAAITRGAALSRGLGRSYGDSSLPAAERDVVAGSRLADRLLHFDESSGILRAEAGLSLRQLNRWSLPRGWFTPVTPGTHYVTLGGMVASDVHGKSHHVDGCFGEHVTALTMRVADGRVIECSDTDEPELLRATLGGMGLTGHILEVAFRLRRIPSPWIWQESERTPDFDTTIARLQDAGEKWPMTVCWADFLTRGASAGRGLLMSGRWAEPSEAPPNPPRFRNPLALPPVFPSWFLQPWMWRILNLLLYAKHGRRVRTGIVHPETFFYPLDVIRDWNRAYGPRGFTQYQAVLPLDDPSRQRRFLNLLQSRCAPVYLCVIKDCGPEGKGMLSFPKPGVSYALDLPVRHDTQALVDTLNEFVIAEGGRIYLTKDAFTRAEHFRAMEPRLDAFLQVRRKWDPHGRLRSAQSVRLFGDPL